MVVSAHDVKMLKQLVALLKIAHTEKTSVPQSVMIGDVVKWIESFGNKMLEAHEQSLKPAQPEAPLPIAQQSAPVIEEVTVVPISKKPKK